MIKQITAGLSDAPVIEPSESMLAFWQQQQQSNLPMRPLHVLARKVDTGYQVEGFFTDFNRASLEHTRYMWERPTWGIQLCKVNPPGFTEEASTNGKPTELMLKHWKFCADNGKKQLPIHAFQHQANSVQPVSYIQGWSISEVSSKRMMDDYLKQYPKARLKMVVFEPPNPTKGKR